MGCFSGLRYYARNGNAVVCSDYLYLIANNRYDRAVKSALVGAGGTGFQFPSCSAPTFASGTNYPGGSKVSFGGCVCKFNDHLYTTKSLLSPLQLHLAGTYPSISSSVRFYGDGICRRSGLLLPNRQTIRTAIGVQVSTLWYIDFSFSFQSSQCVFRYR